MDELPKLNILRAKRKQMRGIDEILLYSPYSHHCDVNKALRAKNYAAVLAG